MGLAVGLLGQEASAQNRITVRVEVGDWYLVASGSPSEPERAALSLLQQRAAALRGTEFPVVPVEERRQREGVPILMGTLATAPRLESTLAHWGWNEKFTEVEGTRVEQSYVLGVSAAGDEVVAGGVGPAGAAYALVDLAAHLIADEEGAALLLTGERDAEGRVGRVEIPAIAERGVYLNIGAPVDPITVHEWPRERWSAYLDQLLMARLNRLYFSLWMDSESYVPESESHHERNRVLHENLRWMIPEAQRRGMKVTFLFTPTLVPRDLWAARPELHAEIEYVDHGFPCVCPSRPESWPFMEAIFDYELEWFKAADGFQIWFYDPGGCMCQSCREDLAGPLAKQVEVFTRLIRTKNPQAEIQVSLWPVWSWEAKLQRKYGVDLLDRLREQFGTEHSQVDIVDSVEGNETFLIPAHARGFRTQAFLYATNVETAFLFLNPQLKYIRASTSRILEQGWTGGFCHRLEPGSKFPNTFFVATSLWQPALSEEELTREYALWATAHPGAAEKLAEALRRWDAWLFHPATAAEGQAILQLIDEALALLPPARREGVAWLRDTARCLEILARGVEEQTARATELREAMAASPLFQNFAERAEWEFPHLVRWMKQGWERERF